VFFSFHYFGGFNDCTDGRKKVIYKNIGSMSNIERVAYY